MFLEFQGQPLVISILTAPRRLVCENKLINGEAAYTTLFQHYDRDADEEEQSTKKKNRSVNPSPYFFVCVLYKDLPLAPSSRVCTMVDYTYH